VTAGNQNQINQNHLFQASQGGVTSTKRSTNPQRPPLPSRKYPTPQGGLLQTINQGLASSHYIEAETFDGGNFNLSGTQINMQSNSQHGGAFSPAGGFEATQQESRGGNGNA